MLLARQWWIVLYLITVSIHQPVNAVANLDVHVLLFPYRIAWQTIVILREVPAATAGLLIYAVILWHVHASRKIVEWQNAVKDKV